MLVQEKVYRKFLTHAVCSDMLRPAMQVLSLPGTDSSFLHPAGLACTRYNMLLKALQSSQAFWKVLC